MFRSRIPHEVGELVAALALRVRGPQVAKWLWHWVLTEDQRRRLGNDWGRAYSRHGGTVGMWCRLHGGSPVRAVVSLATRFRSIDDATAEAVLRAYGEMPSDHRGAVEWAVNRGGLVVDEPERTAYWQGSPIPVDWTTRPKSWEFLRELARCARSGRGLDQIELEGEGSLRPGRMKKLKCRLVKTPGFPPGLAALIQPTERGTYRLEVEPDLVGVFDRRGVDPSRGHSPGAQA